MLMQIKGEFTTIIPILLSLSHKLWEVKTVLLISKFICVAVPPAARLIFPFQQALLCDDCKCQK